MARPWPGMGPLWALGGAALGICLAGVAGQLVEVRLGGARGVGGEDGLELEAGFTPRCPGRGAQHRPASGSLGGEPQSQRPQFPFQSLRERCTLQSSGFPQASVFELEDTGGLGEIWTLTLPLGKWPVPPNFLGIQSGEGEDRRRPGMEVGLRKQPWLGWSPRGGV